MSIVTIAELIQGRDATTLTGDRPIWQDGTGRKFAVASGPCGEWVTDECRELMSDDPDAPVMRASDATIAAPLLVACGVDGLEALAAMGLTRVDE